MPGRQRTTQINQGRTLDALRQLSTFEEALSRLLFVVEHQRPCGLILGHAGTGKSALIEILREELSTPTCTPIVVDLQTSSSTMIAWKIAVGMGLSPNPQDAPELLWTAIDDRLAGASSSETMYVPLFDHLEQADECTAAAVTRCCHIFARRSGSVILCGRPQVPHELIDVVRSMCDLRIELPLWSVGETAQFVAQTQEGKSGPQYTGGAIGVLHHCAGGRLSDVQQLLRLTGFAAETQEIEKIDAKFVESIASEIWRPVTQLDDVSHHPPTILELAAFSQ